MRAKYARVIIWPKGELNRFQALWKELSSSPVPTWWIAEGEAEQKDLPSAWRGLRLQSKQARRARAARSRNNRDRVRKRGKRNLDGEKSGEGFRDLPRGAPLS